MGTLQTTVSKGRFDCFPITFSFWTFLILFVMSLGFFAETKRVVSIVSRFCKFHLKISKHNKKAKPLFDRFGGILIGFSIINHPFWGTPIFGNIHLTPTCKKKHQPGFFERNISEATRERCFGPCLGVSVSSFSGFWRQGADDDEQDGAISGFIPSYTHLQPWFFIVFFFGYFPTL